MKASFVRNVVAAGFLFAAFGASAQAQTARTAYHKYELATVDGQRAVLARIQHSAKRACQGDGTAADHMASRSCTSLLTAQMVAHTGSPVLVALWKGGNVQLASNAR